MKIRELANGTRTQLETIRRSGIYESEALVA